MFGLSGFTARRCSEHLVTEHQGANEALAIAEGDSNRTDVRHDVSRAIGRRDFPCLSLLQAQLKLNVLGNAQHERARVDQR